MKKKLFLPVLVMLLAIIMGTVFGLLQTQNDETDNVTPNAVAENKRQETPESYHIYTAAKVFKGKFRELPGDISDRGFKKMFGQMGNGNGKVDELEQKLFFDHLKKSNLIRDIPKQVREMVDWKRVNRQGK